MSDTNATAHETDWWSSNAFLLIARSFGLAKAVHVMLLATAGALATTAGWRLIELMLPDDFRQTHALVDADATVFSTWPGERIAPISPITGETIAPAVWNSLGLPPECPILAIPHRVNTPLIRLLDLQQRGRAPVFYAVGLAWTVLVWSFFGGAICRMAAMKYTRDERVELADGVRFARSHLLSYLGAFVIPLVGIAALALPVAVLGLLMKFNVGVILSGVLWFSVVAFSFMMVLLLIGLLLGWPLMWGGLACEGTDAFDAVSRAFAYFSQRPFRYFSCLVLAAAIGLLGWLVVWGVSEGMINLGIWSASLGAGGERMAAILDVVHGNPTDSTVLRIGALLIGFWNGAIRTIAAAFAYSFFFTAMTGIYLVLRRDVDHAPFDQVYLEPAPGIPQDFPATGARADVPLAKTTREDRRSDDGQGNGAPDGSSPVATSAPNDQQSGMT